MSSVMHRVQPEHEVVSQPNEPDDATVGTNTVHAPGCPLWEEENDASDKVILEVAGGARTSGRAQQVMEAIAICDHCRDQFREYTSYYREEERHHVSSLAEGLGALRRYDLALKQQCVWFTEDIEEELTRALASANVSPDAEKANRLLYAFVSLMWEVLDIRHPEVPFAHLGPGLLPRGWREADALDYIASEVEDNYRSLSAGLQVLNGLIQDHANLAVEPLGWFIPDGKRGFYLLTWEGLLDTRPGDIGQRLLIRQKESHSQPAYFLKKEYADAIERVRKEARKRGAGV